MCGTSLLIFKAYLGDGRTRLLRVKLLSDVVKEMSIRLIDTFNRNVLRWR